VALALLLASASASAQATHVPADAPVPAHPRILLQRGDEQRILREVASDPLRKKLHDAIIAGADEMLGLEPIQRIQIGRRLLDKSREGLRRSFFLSYTWRTTHEARYLRRAERELVAIAGFSDWNPSYGSDFGLAARPGFLETAGYLVNMTGPTGAAFNYSDSGAGGGLEPAMFWFAETLRDPELLFVERARLEHLAPERLAANRLLPAAMVFGRGVELSASTPPTSLLWAGGGKNPVALMRTSWTDTAAIFVGVKGGSASDNHAHMDAGSFVLDAGGVRWAMDFGAENYNQIEQAGVDLWNRAQSSPRWLVFRYNNLAHNTLTANGALQDVAGRSTIRGTSASPSFLAAVVDLSPVYASSLASAARGIAIVDGDHVVVRDEVKSLPRATTIRWNLATPAAVRITGPASAELTKDGRTLRLTVVEPAVVTMKTWPTVSPHAYESPNPGTTMVGFEFVLPPGSAGVSTVLLEPGVAPRRASTSVAPLDRWPTTPR
jgi:hypothetical protein